jgi:phosphoribosylaminoimidazole carboxylase, PurE protein
MKVAVIMGSINDLEVMKEALEVLEALGIPYEARVVSAHRAPDFMAEFAKRAEEEGFEVIIAGAGGAAHLPGMAASHTPPAGDRGPHTHAASRRPRLASLHSPDAEGHPRRHRGHRRHRQRRLPGRQVTRRQVPRGEGKSEETHGADARRRPLEKLHKIF